MIFVILEPWLCRAFMGVLGVAPLPLSEYKKILEGNRCVCVDKTDMSRWADESDLNERRVLEWQSCVCVYYVQRSSVAGQSSIDSEAVR